MPNNEHRKLMKRATSLIAAFLAAAALANCSSPESRAIHIDFSMGDQCAWMPRERPNDCASRLPCIYSDADLHVARQVNGEYHLFANATGWGNHQPSDFTANASAQSLEALAAGLPRILGDLRAHPQNVTDACIYIDPSLAMSTAEVVALHEALSRQRVRAIGFYAHIADLHESEF